MSLFKKNKQMNTMASLLLVALAVAIGLGVTWAFRGWQDAIGLGVTLAILAVAALCLVWIQSRAEVGDASGRLQRINQSIDLTAVVMGLALSLGVGTIAILRGEVATGTLTAALLALVLVPLLIVASKIFDAIRKSHATP